MKTTGFNPVDEFSVPQETISAGKEYDLGKETVYSPAQELPSASEFTQMPEEYDASANKSSSESPKKDRHKLFRKMGYLVASAVAILALSQAVGDSAMKEYYVNKNTGVFNGYWGNGGVRIRRGSMYDYAGNRIALEAHDTSDFGISTAGNDLKNINQNGYVVFSTSSPDGLLVVNSKGETMFTLEENEAEVFQTYLSDNNVLMVEWNQHRNHIKHCSYYNLKGEELFSTEPFYHSAGSGITGTGFREGISLCYDGSGILKVAKDGSTEYLAQWPVTEDASNVTFYRKHGVHRTERLDETGGYTLQNVPCTILDGLSGGYFLGKTSENYVLADINTGTLHPVLLKAAKSLNVALGKAPATYLDNTGKMYHYGTLMCLKKGSKDTKACLFDVLEHCNEAGELTGYYAYYDEIYFEESPYLAVREGEDYFYIDLKGKVVSRTYQKVSTFNNLGYALVMESDGDVFVIDTTFRQLKQLEDVTDFIIEDEGDLFTVEKKGSQKAFYYGP